MPGSASSTRLDAARPASASRRRRSPGRRGSTCPCRRRRRGGSTPSDAPAAVLISALSSGQSATASEPSRIASVSRCGEATEPASRWSRPITIGARSSPEATISLKRSPAQVALAVAEPADARRAGPGSGRARCARRIQRAMCSWSPNRSRIAASVPRCPPGRPTARPSGTGPCPRRTAAGCRPARSRGRRTRRRRRARRPRRAARCRSRTPRRPRGCSSRIAPTCASTLSPTRAQVVVGVGGAQRRRPARRVSPAGT